MDTGPEPAFVSADANKHNQPAAPDDVSATRHSSTDTHGALAADASGSGHTETGVPNEPHRATPRIISLIEPDGECYVFSNADEPVPDHVLAQIFARTRRDICTGYISELQFVQLVHAFCVPLPKPQRHRGYKDAVAVLERDFLLRLQRWHLVPASDGLLIFREIIKARLAGNDHATVRRFEFFDHIGKMSADAHQIHTALRCMAYIADNNELAIVHHWTLNFTHPGPEPDLVFLKKTLACLAYCCEHPTVHVCYHAPGAGQITWAPVMTYRDELEDTYERLACCIQYLLSQHLFGPKATRVALGLRCVIDARLHQNTIAFLLRGWRWSGRVCIRVEPDAIPQFFGSWPFSHIKSPDVVLEVANWPTGYAELCDRLHPHTNHAVPISVVFVCDSQNTRACIDELVGFADTFHWPLYRSAVENIDLDTARGPALILDCSLLGDDHDTCLALAARMLEAAVRWKLGFRLQNLHHSLADRIRKQCSNKIRAMLVKSK